MNNFEKKVLLHQLAVIKNSNRLKSEFQKVYSYGKFELFETIIKEDIIKLECIELIQKLAPIHFKIGDKVFLLGETTKKEFDFIGDDMGYQVAYELYDMTTEMECGDSYTFYVSSLGFLPFADIDETLKSIEFLNSL